MESKTIDNLLIDMEKAYEENYGVGFTGNGGNLEQLDIAAINLDSILSQQISKQEKATGAEKVAKGTPEYQACKKVYDEVKRKVEASEAKAKFLDKKYTWGKIVYQAENKVAGGF